MNIDLFFDNGNYHKIPSIMPLPSTKYRCQMLLQAKNIKQYVRYIVTMQYLNDILVFKI